MGLLMKLPLSMIRDLVHTSLTAEQIGDLLTMAGFELEGLDEVEGDAVLDIKVMANRGDGLSAMGLAREILAKDSDAKPTDLYVAATQRFARKADTTPGEGRIDIESDACDRFAFRLARNIENGDSPEWLQQRIRQTGQRPISLLVDLANYVMLEQGQPLHTFDLDALGGPHIVVRGGKPGEKLTTLNGDEHEVQPHHLVVCTPERAVGFAGIMGGLDTEVSATTKNLLLESAHFLNTSVRKTRKELGLSTEASYRFERSVDADGVVAAINRFQDLYEQITGRKDFAEGTCDVYHVSAAADPIPLDVTRASALLGMDVTAEQATRYLSALGFEVLDGAVRAPSWRADILREEDVIEEIGRVHGFDQIPETPIRGSATKGGVFGHYRLAMQARDALLRCGLDQIVSHSLRDKHPLDFKDEWRVGPRNPHSPELAYLRDSLLPSLADAAQRNGGKNVQLFEIGKVFVKGEYQTDESPEISFLMTGQVTAPHWNDKNVATVDFWYAKGVVEEIAAALGDTIVFDYPRNPDKRFHPTRQAGVLLNHGIDWAGMVGQIHPDIAEQLGLPEETFLAELDLLVFAIQDDLEHPLKAISRNPAVRRDIAFTIPQSVAYSALDSAIAQAGGDALEHHWLFDVYTGSHVAEGHHSLAIALQFRKMGTNLTDEDANRLRDGVVAAIQELGGVLR